MFSITMEFLSHGNITDILLTQQFLTGEHFPQVSVCNRSELQAHCLFKPTHIYPQYARIVLTREYNKKEREREKFPSIHWAHSRRLNNSALTRERWEGGTMMSWFPLSNHWNRHQPRSDQCLRDFMSLHVNAFVSGCAYASRRDY